MICPRRCRNPPEEPRSPKASTSALNYKEHIAKSLQQIDFPLVAETNSWWICSEQKKASAKEVSRLFLNIIYGLQGAAAGEVGE